MPGAASGPAASVQHVQLAAWGMQFTIRNVSASDCRLYAGVASFALGYASGGPPASAGCSSPVDETEVFLPGSAT